MIDKACTHLLINISSENFKLDFENLAKEKFFITEDISCADFLITNNKTEFNGLQIIIDSSSEFIQSSENIIYFQPFLNQNNGDIDSCVKCLFDFCVYQAKLRNYPITPQKNTILIFD